LRKVSEFDGTVTERARRQKDRKRCKVASREAVMKIRVEDSVGGVGNERRTFVGIHGFAEFEERGNAKVVGENGYSWSLRDDSPRSE
jgi:hypothetical protein